ncbi:MAG: hypothetical protein KAR11_04165 [Phycisphaerae bacterium]|nr:hypothetical protein [Phycisphaerae bacterium]
MKYISILMVVVLGMGFLTFAGCQNMDQITPGLAIGNGSSRNMGDVSMSSAFVAGVKALSAHYSIDRVKTNQANGVIVCKPQNIANAPNERILGGTPARQIARMELVSENDQVIAQVLVVQERNGSGPREEMGQSQDVDNYDGSPGNVTPGNLSAATTPQQNEAWEFEKKLPEIQNVILTDMFNLLHGK